MLPFRLRPRRALTFRSLAVALAAAIAPTLALGAPSPQQIRNAADEFDLGVRAARSRDYEGAASHFENADREAPSAEALQGALRARYDAKQWARAASLADLAAERHPQRKNLVAFARSVLNKHGKHLHRVIVHCEPACDVVADGRIIHGSTARQLAFFLDPGKHTVAVGWGAITEAKEVEASSGKSTELSFARPESPSATEPPPPVASSPPPTPPPAPLSPDPPPAPVTRRSGLPPLVFFGGVAATAAIGGVALWSGIDTRNNPGQARVREECVGLGTDCPAYQDGLSRQRRTNVLLAATGGVGLATAVVGLFFTRWGGSPSVAAGAPALAPAVGLARDAAFVSASGRF
ncbi:MAG: hypothetical protein MUF34_03695 [Polyangiaceae bacterium]|nr:hypothetical protein [Polyangiaceae bacterium]